MRARERQVRNEKQQVRGGDVQGKRQVRKEMHEGRWVKGLMIQEEMGEGEG